MNHDFKNLVEEIREYAKNNGRAIISCDNPNKMKKGWICNKTNKYWEMDIIKILNEIKSLPNDNKKTILYNAFRTQTGNENFNKFLNSKE